MNQLRFRDWTLKPPAWHKIPLIVWHIRTTFIINKKRKNYDWNNCNNCNSCSDSISSIYASNHPGQKTQRNKKNLKKN